MTGVSTNTITRSETVEYGEARRRQGRKTGNMRSATVVVRKKDGRDTAYISRAAAARMLGCCTVTVKRMELRGQIPGTLIDEDGVHRYPMQQIETLKTTMKMTRTTTIPFDPDRASGSASAIVFQRFNENRTPLEIVIELQMEPATVRRLHNEWMQMKNMLTLDPAQCREIRYVLGTFGALDDSVEVGGGGPIPLADDLVNSIKRLPNVAVRKDALLCEVCIARALPSPQRASRCRIHGRLNDRKQTD
jgi:hypothetical protein